LDRRKLTDTGVVDEDVEFAEDLLGLGEEAMDITFVGDVPCTAKALPPAVVISATTLSAPSLLEE
jgi:hypothetical protein